MERLLEIDGSILLWIQDNLRCPVLDWIMKCVTRLGNSGMIWISCVVIMLLFKKSRHTGTLTIFAMLINLLVSNLLLKNLVARTRPYDAVLGLESIIGRISEYSFPSGHASHSFAAAVVIFMLMPKKIGIPSLILATLISFSRIYIGVHYPTDIIAGALIGSIIAIIIVTIDRKKCNSQIKDERNQNK